ncbi:MAG: helix-turn-helix domain-containing protein [Bacillota bacterium]
MSKNIGAKIREIRTAKGVTQVHIARVLGKSSGWLNNIEKGRRPIDAEELKKIADILSTPVSDFFNVNVFNVTFNGPTGTEGS